MASKTAAAAKAAAKSKAKQPAPKKPPEKPKIVAKAAAPAKVVPVKAGAKPAAKLTPAEAQAAKLKAGNGKPPVSNVEAIKAVAIKAAAKGALPAAAAAADKDAETTDSPLLDLSDAAVRKMIKQAKKRGYVTYEQLNGVLPSEEVTSEKIEDVLAMLNDMGINVVENEDAGEDEEGREEEDDEDEGGDLVEVSQKSVAETTKKSEPGDRPDAGCRAAVRATGGNAVPSAGLSAAGLQAARPERRRQRRRRGRGGRAAE